MKVVIIGNHAAGLSAAQTLRRLGKDCEIVIVSKEDVPPYSRCLIPYLVSGEKQLADILFQPEDFYSKYAVQTLLGQEVLKVLPEEKAVLLSDGNKLAYDSLIIASGSHAVALNIPGTSHAGVFSLRNLQDAEAIRAYADDVREVVVLGAGLVGLKAAVALAKQGKKITVIMGSPNVLSQIVSSQEAGVFERYLELMGIQVVPRTNPAVVLGKDKVEGVETTDGRQYPCQMVIAAKGVRSNIEIVKGTKITTEYGIIIDDHCRTSVPDVYAAGDVSQSPDSVRGETWQNTLWPHAVEAGRVAAENVLGFDTAMRSRTAMNSFSIGDVSLISCGLTGARERVEDAEEIIDNRPKEKQVRRFIIRDGVLLGFSLVGEVAHAGVLTALVVKQVNIESVRDLLAVGKYDFSSLLPLIKANRDKFFEPEYKEVLAGL